MRWGLESFLSWYDIDCRKPEAVRFPVFVCLVELPTTPPKIHRLGSNFWEGTDSVEHATGIFFVNPLPAYHRIRMPGAVRFPVFVCLVELPTMPPKIHRLGLNFWEGTEADENATGIFIDLYFWRTSGGVRCPADGIDFFALRECIIFLHPTNRRQRGITARGGKSIRREIFRSGKVVFLQEYFVYFKGKRRIPGGKDPSKAAADPRGIAPQKRSVAGTAITASDFEAHFAGAGKTDTFQTMCRTYELSILIRATRRQKRCGCFRTRTYTRHFFRC